MVHSSRGATPRSPTGHRDHVGHVVHARRERRAGATDAAALTARDLDGRATAAPFGADDGDTVVWGTDDGDTVVWGTSDDGDTVVWGTSCDRSELRAGGAGAGRVTRARRAACRGGDAAAGGAVLRRRSSSLLGAFAFVASLPARHPRARCCSPCCSSLGCVTSTWKVTLPIGLVERLDAVGVVRRRPDGAAAARTAAGGRHRRRRRAWRSARSASSSAIRCIARCSAPRPKRSRWRHGAGVRCGSAAPTGALDVLRRWRGRWSARLRTYFVRQHRARRRRDRAVDRAHGVERLARRLPVERRRASWRRRAPARSRPWSSSAARPGWRC